MLIAQGRSTVHAILCKRRKETRLFLGLRGPFRGDAAIKGRPEARRIVLLTTRDLFSPQNKRDLKEGPPLISGKRQRGKLEEEARGQLVCHEKGEKKRKLRSREI